MIWEMKYYIFSLAHKHALFSQGEKKNIFVLRKKADIFMILITDILHSYDEPKGALFHPAGSLQLAQTISPLCE